MTTKSVATIKMLVFGIVALSAVFSDTASVPIKLIWWGISGYCGVKALLISFKRRTCGHGAVTQSGPFFYPWIVDPCPKCGENSYLN